MTIDTVKVFPSIGIDRIGNSLDKVFIGPEIPGDRPIPTDGYKDSSGNIKRQAARFRLFGYEAGIMIKEITIADADIQWTVELANTKAAWKEFGGIEDQNSPNRNSGIDPITLKITPGPRTLNGPNQKAAFNTGKFLNTLVPLGEIQTDNDCRLLVIGGSGKSESPTIPPSPLVHWANNDGWYDDVSSNSIS